MKPLKQVGALVGLIFFVLVQPGFPAGSGASDVVRQFLPGASLEHASRREPWTAGALGRLAPIVPRVFNIPYMT